MYGTLILKMEENKQHFRHIMLYYFKVKIQLKHTKTICAIYGEDTVTGQTCQKWFANFHAGDFLLHNTPQLGRPVS